MNSTSRSNRMAASGCDFERRSCGSLRCRIGARCKRTLYVKLLSCIIELAYWSSDMHVKIKKQSFKLDALDSFLLSCMTIELEREKNAEDFKIRLEYCANKLLTNIETLPQVNWSDIVCWHPIAQLV